MFRLESQEEYFEVGWVVPDGAGMMLASRVLGIQIRRRITGTDLCPGLSQALQEAGSGWDFFLMFTAAVLEQVRPRLIWVSRS